MLNQVRANFTVAKVMGRYTGCQMRMLLGHRCFAQPSGRDMYGGDEISVARARERLSRLYFVGLVSEFRLSVCLMNYRLTGYRFVTQFQTKNCRPTMLDARSPRLNITDPGGLQLAATRRAGPRHLRQCGRALLGGRAPGRCERSGVPRVGDAQLRLPELMVADATDQGRPAAGASVRRQRDGRRAALRVGQPDQPSPRKDH